MAVAGAATAALVLPLGWLWQASRLPDSYSTMDMGYADDGQPMHRHGHGQSATGRSVTSLVADPRRPADIAVTLTARTQRFRLPSGRTVDGYTLNGQSPGPVVSATVGQLVQVRLVNESVASGVTLHWHGVDVPNAADGVAGVTQDAVGVGEAFTYRFVADRVGTFWYHSHQVAHEQVRRGLLGALVVVPVQRTADVVDVVALVHLYDGVRTVNGREGDDAVEVPPGALARVRVINTDSGPMSVWVAGASFRVVAVDGMNVNGPSLIRDTSVVVTAGGRADLEVSTPTDGSPVRIHLGGSAAVVLGSTSFRAPTVARPAATLDRLSYGATAPLDFDPQTPDRSFQYNIGRRPGFSTVDPACGGPSTATCSRTCPCSWSPRATWFGCTSPTAAATSIPCTCTATMRWCSAATAFVPLGVPGGSTRSMSATASRTTLRSSPITPASGWITATTCPTRPRGSSPTSCTRESPRRSPCAARRATNRSEPPREADA